MDSMKYVFARFHITLTVGRQGGVDPLRLFTLTIFEVRVAVTCGNIRAQHGVAMT